MAEICVAWGDDRLFRAFSTSQRLVDMKSEEDRMGMRNGVVGVRVPKSREQ